MRVLLIANTLPPDDISGVGEQVLQLAAGLRGRGHEVEVLGRSHGAFGRIKLLFPLTIVAPAHRAIVRFRPDVVQVHESDGALAALWACATRSVRSPSPRVVALQQVSYLEEWRAVRPLRDRGRVVGLPGLQERLFKWFKAPIQILLGRMTAWLADAVLAPSRATAGEIERDYGVMGVAVLPNVMGGREVEAEEDSTSGAQADFLLYVGRLRIRKGIEVLLAALASGEDGLPLIVVGEGEHGEWLERASSRLGLADSVRFVGRRSPGQVRSLMRRATALVVPSIYEGMPLVILEAMEAGLPVIASAVSGIPEVVEPGVTGWLVPAEDSVALARAIGELQSDPEEARRRGLAGRESVEGRFSVERAAEVWDQIVVETEA